MGISTADQAMAKLCAGLNQLQESTASLPESSTALNNGASQLSAGLEQVTAGAQVQKVVQKHYRQDLKK